MLDLTQHAHLTLLPTFSPQPTSSTVSQEPPQKKGDKPRYQSQQRERNLCVPSSVAAVPVIAEAVGKSAVRGVQGIKRVILASREAVAVATEDRHTQAMASRLEQVVLAVP